MNGIAVRPDGEFDGLEECDEGRDEGDTVNWESKKVETYRRIGIFGKMDLISIGWNIKAAEYLWRLGWDFIGKTKVNCPRANAIRPYNPPRNERAVNQIFHHR